MACNRLKNFEDTFVQKTIFEEKLNRERKLLSHLNTAVYCEHDFSKKHENPCQEKNDIF